MVDLSATLQQMPNCQLSELYRVEYKRYIGTDKSN